MTECDPCRYCRLYAEYYDDSTGITDASCDAEDEFAVCDVKPCPYFRPILASEGLFWDLETEAEERFYKELEKEREEMENE